MLSVVFIATATLGAVSTLAAPIIPTAPVTARELESDEPVSHELERRQFGLQGIINAIAKTAPEISGASKAPTSALRSMVKSEAKAGLHQEKDKPVARILMGSMATRDLKSPMESEYDDGARAYAREYIFDELD